MRKAHARRLKAGTIVSYGENSRDLPSWWGRVVRTTEAGGVLVAEFERHWREAPPEPEFTREVMYNCAWDDCGPRERWIPAAWIYRAA